MRRIPLHVLGLLVLFSAGCSGDQVAPPSVAQLQTMLADPDPKVQIEATSWIAQLGPRAAETVTALEGVLKCQQPPVRRSAAVALGKIGPAAATAVPALMAALADTDADVRRFAADALGQLGPAAQAAIPALEKLSKVPDPCNSAQNALKRIRS